MFQSLVLLDPGNVPCCCHQDHSAIDGHQSTGQQQNDTNMLDTTNEYCVWWQQQMRPLLLTLPLLKTGCSVIMIYDQSSFLLPCCGLSMTLVPSALLVKFLFGSFLPYSYPIANQKCFCVVNSVS